MSVLVLGALNQKSKCFAHKHFIFSYPLIRPCVFDAQDSRLTILKIQNICSVLVIRVALKCDRFPDQLFMNSVKVARVSCLNGEFLVWSC